LIIGIAGAIFYVVCPKYKFFHVPNVVFRGNKVTGQFEFWSKSKQEWRIFGKQYEKETEKE
jgi:hypothetical protein